MFEPQLHSFIQLLEIEAANLFTGVQHIDYIIYRTFRKPVTHV